MSTNNSTNNSITITNYTEKSILVKGDTKPIKDKLKEIGGRYNQTLGGWIFSKTKKSNVEDILANKLETNEINFEKKQVENKIQLIPENIILNQDNIITTINDMFSQMNYEERLRFILMITNLACVKNVN